MQSYEMLRIIGEGAFGNAYLALHLEEFHEYVVKKIDLRNKAPKQVENIYHQVELLKQFRHVNIVSFRDSVIDKAHFLNIVMEYCEAGDMAQLIEQFKQGKNRRLEEKKIIDWAVQIALAIFYLHDRRILHRDLKTPNIFLQGQVVKLGDFGISKVLDESMDLASTNIGTPYYMSPEHYRQKPYSYKSDIWAFGCILYEMCNLRRPFEAASYNGLAVKILEGHFAPVSDYYSQPLRELIRSMLSKNAKDRPSVTEFLQRPIMRKRVIAYVKQMQEKLKEEPQILGSLLEQAAKLKIPLDETPKHKQEQVKEKKRREELVLKLELEEQAKKDEQLRLKKIEQIKREEAQQREKQAEMEKKIEMEEREKNKEREIMEANRRKEEQLEKERKKKAVPGPTVSGPTVPGPTVPGPTEEQKKRFQLKQDYDMYDCSFEGEDQDPQPYDSANYLQRQDPTTPLEKEESQLRDSLKAKDLLIGTLRNQISNIDFQYSSSEDQQQEQKPKVDMRKRMRNPVHVRLADKINELRVAVELIVSAQQVRALQQARDRAQIQKIVGVGKAGAYHFAMEIVKLERVLERVPMYSL